VGVVGTAVDFGLLVALRELLGFPTLPANCLSYAAGVVNSFVLNRLWTYPDSRQKVPLVQLAQFAAVSMGGLILNSGIVAGMELLLRSVDGLQEHGYLIAKVVATAVTLIWNFLANRVWTFNDVK
jgi:putative flippase GtrA